MTDKRNIWAVVGVANRAKDIAKKLAKKSGKNIGPWLEQVIYNQEDLENTTLYGGAGGSSLVHQIPSNVALGGNDNSSYGATSVDSASIHTKLDDLTKQVASLAMQIYDLKIYGKFEKKSFWSRFS